VVADKLKVCGTCDRKQLNLLYCGEECLSTNSAFLIGAAVFCCQRGLSRHSTTDPSVHSRSCLIIKSKEQFPRVARSLLANVTCKRSAVKITIFRYNSGYIEFFLGDCFLLARPP